MSKKSMRTHRVMHPVLGLMAWREIQSCADARREAGERICSWCFGPLKYSSQRTRCSQECGEMVWRAYSWQRTARQVIRRDKATCRLCGNDRCMIEVDHIVPVSLGGSGDIDNLRAVCSSCHKLETVKLRREGELYKAASDLAYCPVTAVAACEPILTSHGATSATIGPPVRR
jgi:5-methylcytosine-specific restriction endonuclease McrA